MRPRQNAAAGQKKIHLAPDATDGQPKSEVQNLVRQRLTPDVVGYDFSGEDFDLYQDFSLNPAGQISGLDISNPLYHFDDTGTTLGNYVPNGLNQYQSANAKTF
ncbi:hypothetical protein, partial [Saccharophagus sp. K07]|uniref:hypothetical protein n=1 Tax=Saccharophagus sp. K07 TaxID=2283636 RepID=UPI001CA372B2